MARVAVIGAGAAGISAGRSLAAAGAEVVLFEARERIGGRAWTDTAFARHPVELGAEFVHGERVATWQWIRELGALWTGAAHSYQMWFHLDRSLLDREAAQTHFGTDPLTALERLARRWVASGHPEASLDAVLDLWPEVSDTPLNEERRRLIANYMAELASSDLDRLSTHRAADRPVEPPETLRHFRLTSGYSALLEGAASGLPIRLNTAVSLIRWDERGVEVHAGQSRERYDRAIVTLPLGVLRRRVVEFQPALPEAKLAAIERLNPGSISKVILRLDRVCWPHDMTFLWTPLTTQLWWRPGQGQSEEEPVLTAFFGGRDAAALEGASEAEAVDEAARQLASILGQSLAGRVLGGRYVAWGADPFTLMGYSSVPPGGGGLRAALAAPAGALSFAGEATSLDHPATVHGAIASGRRAAAEALESLGLPAQPGERDPW